MILILKKILLFTASLFLTAFLASCPAVVNPENLDSEFASVLMGLSADNTVHRFSVRGSENLQFVFEHDASIENYDNNEDDNSDTSYGKIHLVLPPASIVSSITPYFDLAENADISPDGTLDLASVQSFTVKAEDGTERIYEFTYEIQDGTTLGREITGFMFKKGANTGNLYYDIYPDLLDSVTDPGTITLNIPNNAVPPSTVITDFVPSFELTGNELTFGGPVIASGTDSITFNPTATVNVNGNGTKQYNITVNVEENSAKDITLFRFLDADNAGISSDYTGTIAGNNITVNVTSGDITNLTASVNHSAESNYIPAGGIDYTGSDAVPVVFTVTAEDGTSQNYNVSVVTGVLSSEKNITGFEFNISDNPSLSAVYPGTITGTDITVDISDIEDITSLVPAIISSPLSSVTPVGSVDFTNSDTVPVEYTVSAEDGSTQIYSVSVNILSSAKDISAFSFDNAVNTGLGITYDAAVAAPGIDLLMPVTEDITSLTPTITASAGATVSPSGPQDFSSSDIVAIPYTVTAEDGSSQVYNVSVSKTGWNYMGDILTYTASTGQDLDMTVDQSNNNIACAYRDSTNGNGVSVLFWQGGPWKDLGDKNFTGGMTSDLSITVRSSDNHYYVANQLSTAGDLRISESNFGAAWTACGTDIDADGTPNLPLSDIEATTSSVFVIFRDVKNGDQVRVYEWNGSALSDLAMPGLLTSTAANRYNFKLTADVDTLYASYYDNAGAFTMQKFTGSAWLDAGTASFSSVDPYAYFDVADQSGALYSATVESGNIVVRKFDGGSVWSAFGTPVTDADVSISAGNFIKLEVNYNGDVYLFYRDSSFHPKLVKFNSAGAKVDAEGILPGDYINHEEVSYGNIAVDNTDKLYIGYRDDSDSGKIKILTF